MEKPQPIFYEAENNLNLSLISYEDLLVSVHILVVIGLIIIGLTYYLVKEHLSKTKLFRSILEAINKNLIWEILFVIFTIIVFSLCQWGLHYLCINNGSSVLIMLIFILGCCIIGSMALFMISQSLKHTRLDTDEFQRIIIKAGIYTAGIFSLSASLAIVMSYINSAFFLKFVETGKFCLTVILLGILGIVFYAVFFDRSLLNFNKVSLLSSGISIIFSALSIMGIYPILKQLRTYYPYLNLFALSCLTAQQMVFEIVQIFIQIVHILSKEQQK